MLADDVRLIQVRRYPLRAGAADVGMFFRIYSRSARCRSAPASLDGREVNRGLRGSGGEAQLHDVAGMDRTAADQLHPRLQICSRYVIDDAELVLAPDTGGGRAWPIDSLTRVSLRCQREHMIARVIFSRERINPMAKEQSESVYRIIDVVGVSETSWEDAGRIAVETAAGSLRDLRVAEVTKMDMKVDNGKVTAYRTRVALSFKYET